jgi:hypothetical protein
MSGRRAAITAGLVAFLYTALLAFAVVLQQAGSR